LVNVCRPSSNWGMPNAINAMDANPISSLHWLIFSPHARKYICREREREIEREIERGRGSSVYTSTLELLGAYFEREDGGYLCKGPSIPLPHSLLPSPRTRHKKFFFQFRFPCSSTWANVSVLRGGGVWPILRTQNECWASDADRNCLGLVHWAWPVYLLQQKALTTILLVT
jgi:hypothetical protein